MDNITEVKNILNGLIESTKSPVYSTCIKIVLYLENHPQQQDLTIMGLRAALDEKEGFDNLLIKAAFTLSAHPFKALEVRYKLYDEDIRDVLDDLDQSTYVKAVSEREFVDSRGNEIHIDELNSRVFPYFINLFHTSSTPSVKAGGEL